MTDAVLTVDQQFKIAEVSSILCLVHGLVMVLAPHKQTELFYGQTTNRRG